MKKTELNQNIYLSQGNNKLKANETSYFLIWNIPAVVTCPYRTPLCEKNCYARKAEIQYPQVTPCRERNYQESLKYTFVNDMIDHINYQLNLPKHKGKKCYFRIHEAGDFYSTKYFNKFVFIASCFPEITFLAYTKSIQLLYFTMKNTSIPNNLIIRYSVWSDTDQHDIELAQDLDLPIYTAFDKEVLEDRLVNENYMYCHCDCKICKRCYNKQFTRIACEIH